MYQRTEIIGRLGHPPSTRSMPDGSPVCSFSVATDEKWTGKDGQKHEETEWFNVVCFGKLAEICEQYLDKGKLIFLAGKMKTRSWDDKDGKKQYKTELIASEMKMLGGKSDPDNATKVERPADTVDEGSIPF